MPAYIDLTEQSTRRKQLPIQKRASQPPKAPQSQISGRDALPIQIRQGMEQLSGYRLDDVKVHYRSDKPRQLQALAYTQGTDIYVAPGEERHLPHEAWHVVQQKQGRVRPTADLGNVKINDNPILEKEADAMGQKALTVPAGSHSDNRPRGLTVPVKVAQAVRYDNVKLVASQVGADPTVGQAAAAPAPARLSNMTCHHIIPADLLGEFYNLCQDLGAADHTIKALLERWEATAVKSANETARWRERNPRIRPADYDYDEEIISACQWMNGNIFIGPLAQTRIDDTHGNADFDYGGFRTAEGLGKSAAHKIPSTNQKMDTLLSIHTAINAVVHRPAGEAPDTTAVIHILKGLIEVAATKDTMHREFSSRTPEAYSTRDWISVGMTPIQGMENKNTQFQEMYNTYHTLPANRRTSQQQDYATLFERYINRGECANLTNPGRQYTIARNTYFILLHAWEQTAARRKS